LLGKKFISKETLTPLSPHQEISASQLHPKKNPLSYLPMHHPPPSGKKIGLELNLMKLLRQRASQRFDILAARWIPAVP